MRIKNSILLTAMVLISCSGLSLATEKTNAKPSETSIAEKHFHQGRQALFQGKYETAIELLKKAVDGDKTKTGYRLHLARACYYAGREQEAEKLLSDILKETADHIEAGQMLGEIYKNQKKWQQVVDVIEPLLTYRHDYPTYHLLAEAEYNLSNYEKARKYFEEAIKLNPQSGSDYYQLGNIYLAGNSILMDGAYIAFLSLMYCRR